LYTALNKLIDKIRIVRYDNKKEVSVMKKSVYSLMLFDEIVEKVDELAYINNTNRSQLINDILAEHIGLITPEQKIQRVLEQLDRNFSDTLSVSQVSSNSSIQFGKSIKYKYRPKVRYSYEFVTKQGKKYAVLKVSSRTKSEALNECFDDFFSKIEAIEKRNHTIRKSKVQNETNHKFVREFSREAQITNDVPHITQVLTDYLKMIDFAMNYYFDSIDIKDKDENLQKIYWEYYKPALKYSGRLLEDIKEDQ